MHQRFEDPLPIFAAVQKIGKPDMAYREAFDPCLPRPLRAEAGQRFREQAGRERQYAFEPFKLAFRGAVIVRTVIKVGVHGPENSLGERIGRQIFNAFEHGVFRSVRWRGREAPLQPQALYKRVGGGQFVQYGGAFFAEFRLIGADQASAKHRPPRPGRFALRLPQVLRKRFCASRSAGIGVPAFQEGDDAETGGL